MIDRKRGLSALIQSLRWVLVGGIVAVVMDSYDALGMIRKTLILLFAIGLLWVFEYQLLRAEDELEGEE